MHNRVLWRRFARPDRARKCGGRTIEFAQIRAPRSGATAASGSVLEDATRLALFVRSAGAAPLRFRVDPAAPTGQLAPASSLAHSPRCMRPLDRRRRMRSSQSERRDGATALFKASVGRCLSSRVSFHARARVSLGWTGRSSSWHSRRPGADACYTKEQPSAWRDAHRRGAAGLHQMRQRRPRLGRGRNDDEVAASGARLRAAGCCQLGSAAVFVQDFRIALAEGTAGAGRSCWPLAA